MEGKLGKIKEASFGHGGYQDVMLGISFELGGEGWGVMDFWGAWSAHIKADDKTKWTEESRKIQLGEVSMRISQLLLDAKVDRVEQLTGTPIRIFFDGNTLKSWEVLKEVI